VEKRKIFCPCQKLNPMSLVIQPIPYSYTDWAILIPDTWSGADVYQTTWISLQRFGRFYIFKTCICRSSQQNCVGELTAKTSRLNQMGILYVLICSTMAIYIISMRVMRHIWVKSEEIVLEAMFSSLVFRTCLIRISDRILTTWLRLSVVFLSPSRIVPWLGHIHFFSNPFESSFIVSPCDLTLYSLDNESIINPHTDFSHVCLLSILSMSSNKIIQLRVVYCM
jgi:hypothetical protein